MRAWRQQSSGICARVRNRPCWQEGADPVLVRRLTVPPLALPLSPNRARLALLYRAIGPHRSRTAINKRKEAAITEQQHHGDCDLGGVLRLRFRRRMRARLVWIPGGLGQPQNQKGTHPRFATSLRCSQNRSAKVQQPMMWKHHKTHPRIGHRSG